MITSTCMYMCRLGCPEPHVCVWGGRRKHCQPTVKHEKGIHVNYINLAFLSHILHL